MDLFKTKLTKSNRQLLIVALSLVAAAVTLYVVYAATTRRNISLTSPEGQPDAANPSCLLNLTLYRPTPSPSPTATPVIDLICNSTCTTGSTNQCPTGLTCSNGKCRNPSCTSKTNCLCATPTPTPKVTPTPTPSVCKITTTPKDHTAVCWTNPQAAVLAVKIDSLPNTNAPYYLQTDWYIAAPTEGEHHYYTLPNPISAGQTYNITGQWPGIPEGSNETIDIVIGYNVVDKNGNLLGGACANGFNYYWTPYVTCPSPTPISCVNWGVNENSGTGSKIVKINSALTSVTTVKDHACSSGYCEIESMDYDQNTNALYVVPNVAPTRGLYKVNTTNGALTLHKAFSPAFQVNGLAFKNNDSSKAWLWRNGYGLYTMDMNTGTTSRILTHTTYSDFESIVWDNAGRYMYASRNRELWRYDNQASSNQFVRIATNLPGKTDSLDFAPSNYLGGMLIGYSEGNNNYFTYNVSTKSVVKNYGSVGINGDGFAACIPN